MQSQATGTAKAGADCGPQAARLIIDAAMRTDSGSLRFDGDLAGWSGSWTSADGGTRYATVVFLDGYLTDRQSRPIVDAINADERVGKVIPEDLGVIAWACHAVICPKAVRA